MSDHGNIKIYKIRKDRFPISFSGFIVFPVWFLLIYIELSVTSGDGIHNVALGRIFFYFRAALCFLLCFMVSLLFLYIYPIVKYFLGRIYVAVDDDMVMISGLFPGYKSASFIDLEEFKFLPSPKANLANFLATGIVAAYKDTTIKKPFVIPLFFYSKELLDDLNNRWEQTSKDVPA